MSFTRLFTIPFRESHRFMKARSGASLWSSVTSVSNAGKKRGRGRTMRPTVDLNKGQRLGEGLNFNVRFPGLAANPYQELREPGAATVAATTPAIVAHNDARREELFELRSRLGRKRGLRRKKTPFERGYTGARIAGQKFGPPEAEGERAFEGFESVCLEHKIVAHGSSRGHVRRFSTMMAVGNGQGLIGVGVAKSLMAKAALRASKGKAANRLEFVERLHDRTIYQDFYAEVGATRLFAQRVGEGHGIQAHRVLRDVCHLVGIQDINIRLEGAKHNQQNMVKAFLTGLRHQETFQALAERKQLHVVEFSKSGGYMPRIVASPKLSGLRSSGEVSADEALELDDLYGGGRVPYDKAPKRPFFWGMSTFIHTRWLEWPFRNHDAVRRRLLADGLVPSWNVVHRRRWAEARHQALLDGQATLPQGIGLHNCTRVALQEDKDD